MARTGVEPLDRKKPAKVLLFFHSRKYFRRKMQKKCNFGEKATFLSRDLNQNVDSGYRKIVQRLFDQLRLFNCIFTALLVVYNKSVFI